MPIDVDLSRKILSVSLPAMYGSGELVKGELRSAVSCPLCKRWLRLCARFDPSENLLSVVMELEAILYMYKSTILPSGVIIGSTGAHYHDIKAVRRSYNERGCDVVMFLGSPRDLVEKIWDEMSPIHQGESLPAGEPDLSRLEKVYYVNDEITFNPVILVSKDFLSSPVTYFQIQDFSQSYSVRTALVPHIFRRLVFHEQ